VSDTPRIPSADQVATLCRRIDQVRKLQTKPPRQQIPLDRSTLIQAVREMHCIVRPNPLFDEVTGQTRVTPIWYFMIGPDLIRIRKIADEMLDRWGPKPQSNLNAINPRLDDDALAELADIRERLGAALEGVDRHIESFDGVEFNHRTRTVKHRDNEHMIDDESVYESLLLIARRRRITSAQITKELFGSTTKTRIDKLFADNLPRWLRDLFPGKRGPRGGYRFAPKN
jgi:hypothetical protein